MGERGRTETVVLSDVRDADRCLRVTWHPDTGTVVFSHWNGPMCAASTPVDLADASRLVELLVGALRHQAEPATGDTSIVALPRRRPVGDESGADESGQ
ncbi:MAG TPA: hypothetical protein VG435_18245 [Acidimicrobiales bacterium]|jgi:hypothetical protein|nr:hypothetical protein [Acidimicrobiales bacterium]